MIRKDTGDVSDDDLENNVVPAYSKIMKYVKETFLNEFVAYDFAIYYEMNAMWSEPFEIQMATAIEDLAQLDVEDCNKEVIKDILLKKYGLKIVNETTLEVEKIQQ